MVEELAKHWEELGRRQESESTMEEDRMEGSEVRSDICEMVTFDDVVGILKQLKRGKATGPDGIRYEDGGDYGEAGTFAEDTSVEDFIKAWKQVWCWKGNSQDGFRLKQGYAKVARCHRCYTAYT